MVLQCYAYAWIMHFVKSVLQGLEIVDFYKNVCRVNLVIHKSKIVDI